MRGDVVIIDYPFGDGSGSKVRPALVVQDDAIVSVNVILALITSQTGRTGPSRLFVDPSAPDGRGSGLRPPSVVMCENLYTAHRRRVLGVIGTLPAATMSRIDACLKAALGLP